jgi:hypothetical protein
MTNPHGVPHAHNSTPYPTRPRWMLVYRLPGDPDPHQRAYDVLREAEARSRLAAEVPDAYSISATFNEVPL